MGYRFFNTSQILADDVGSLPAQGSYKGQFAYVDSTDEVYAWDGAAWDLIGPPGTGGAPDNADYLVKTANAGLSAERVVTDTTSITWDWATAGQAKAIREALTGDVTAAQNSNATTIANNAVTPAKMDDGAALSVLGRSTNSSGDRADIAASADGQVLTRSSSTLVWQVPTGLPSASSPSTYSPYLWLDAEQDDATYNDGDAVGTATDWSGNGRHMGQSTAGKKPTFKTNIVNGKPVYRFDGGDCLTLASVTVTSHTLIVVQRGASPAGIIAELGPDANANDGFWLYQSSPPILVRKGGVVSARICTANFGIQDEWLVLAQQYTNNHAEHAMFQLLIRLELPTSVGNNPGTGSVTATLNVGARNNAASLGLTGDIAELVLYTPSITGEQTRAVIEYMLRKYNL